MEASSITWTSMTSSRVSSVAEEDRLVVEAVVVATTNSSTSTWVEEVEVLGSNSSNSKKLSQICLRTQM